MDEEAIRVSLLRPRCSRRALINIELKVYLILPNFDNLLERCQQQFLAYGKDKGQKALIA